jgi:hypothetical protein
MALRAVPEHPKFARLKRTLRISKFEALGLLEALWHFTGKFAPRGNVGKFTDLEIEDWLEWNGDPGFAVKGLIASGWLDESKEFRLVVHDWKDHADATTKKYMGRTGEGFVQDMSEPNGKDDGPPVPVPVPVPEPVPVPVPVVPPPVAELELAPKKIPDPRHAPFKEALKKYYAHKAKMVMTWSVSEAKQLSEFLVANPLLTLADFQTILNHRARSDVTHSERPRTWLANATDFLNEPLDRFKKPLGGNTHVKPERAEQILTGAQRLDEKLRSQAVGQSALSSGGVDETQPAVGRLCS